MKIARSVFITARVHIETSNDKPVQDVLRGSHRLLRVTKAEAKSFVNLSLVIGLKVSPSVVNYIESRHISDDTPVAASLLSLFVFLP